VQLEHGAAIRAPQASWVEHANDRITSALDEIAIERGMRVAMADRAVQEITDGLDEAGTIAHHSDRAEPAPGDTDVAALSHRAHPVHHGFDDFAKLNLFLLIGAHVYAGFHGANAQRAAATPPLP
jgi:hypothetical protein